MDATWHARPRGSATRTRAARHVAQYIIYYIMYTYINRSLSSSIWGGSYPYRRSDIIYPTGPCFLFRVGLSSTRFSWCRWRGWSRGVGSSGRSTIGRRSCGPMDHWSLIAHVSLKKSYNGHDLISKGSIWRVGSRSNGADLRRFITPDLKAASGPFDRDLTNGIQAFL